MDSAKHETDMDDLAALRLQLEWGVDEALADAPVDRLAAAPRATAPAPPAQARAAPAPALPAAPSDLAALQAALDALDHPLRATATTTVAPSGNPAAGLVLVAEAPGRDDDRAGTAFAGLAGQALDAALGHAGLDRSRLLLTFLVPWRPPGGREPNPAEVAACLPYLHRLLALAATRRLVLLGQLPVRAMTSLNLRQVRGRWTDVSIPGHDTAIPALPMLPPDQWRKSPANRRNTWTDLLNLASTLDPPAS